MGDVFMASIKIHAYGHVFLCEGDKVSTPPHESCKNPLHELVERRRTFRSSRLSPWQSERGLDPRGAGIDRAEGTCRLHLRGSCPLGGGESGGALPAFPRPRRTVDRCSTAGLQGNPAGGPVGPRHRQQLNGEFIAALLRDFRHGGPAAIAKVRKNQPAAYCKLLTLLCPRDVKVDHSGGVKAMSDEEIEQAIELHPDHARGASR